jgi:hypothetical protein
MDRLIISRHARLFQRLTKSRMGMARARNILRRRAVLHGQHALGHHLAGVGADDVDAEDAVRGLVRQHLDGAVRVAGAAGPAVGHEREGALYKKIIYY